jgi:hypothetical protein
MQPIQLLPIGQRVTHFDGGPHSHGKGTIVGYNNITPNSYAKENPRAAAQAIATIQDAALQSAMMGAMVSGFYDGNRCPYVVHWDPRNDDSEIGRKYPQGYKDVYEPDSIRVIPGEVVEVVQ